MKRKSRSVFVVAVVGVLVVAAAVRPIRNALRHVVVRARGEHTVAERVTQYGTGVADRLRPAFAAAGVDYPPADLAFVVLKDARVLDLYAGKSGSAWTFIKTYPVVAASGGGGPKLREGDLQVPEGIYAVESLNPNSLYHLSLRVNYPNDFDRRMGATDGRTDLGGDIMIHGSNASIGCLAMGDEAAEDLFVLAALTGVGHVKIIISPTDFRVAGAAAPPLPAHAPPWTAGLYATIRDALRPFRR